MLKEFKQRVKMSKKLKSHLDERKIFLISKALSGFQINVDINAQE